MFLRRNSTLSQFKIGESEILNKMNLRERKVASRKIANFGVGKRKSQLSPKDKEYYKKIYPEGYGENITKKAAQKKSSWLLPALSKSDIEIIKEETKNIIDNYLDKELQKGADPEIIEGLQTLLDRVDDIESFEEAEDLIDEAVDIIVSLTPKKQLMGEPKRSLEKRILKAGNNIITRSFEVYLRKNDTKALEEASEEVFEGSPIVWQYEFKEFDEDSDFPYVYKIILSANKKELLDWLNHEFYTADWTMDDVEKHWEWVNLYADNLYWLLRDRYHLIASNSNRKIGKKIIKRSRSFSRGRGNPLSDEERLENHRKIDPNIKSIEDLPPRGFGRGRGNPLSDEERFERHKRLHPKDNIKSIEDLPPRGTGLRRANNNFYAKDGDTYYYVDYDNGYYYEYNPITYDPDDPASIDASPIGLNSEFIKILENKKISKTEVPDEFADDIYWLKENKKRLKGSVNRTFYGDEKYNFTLEELKEMPVGYYIREAGDAFYGNFDIQKIGPNTIEVIFYRQDHPNWIKHLTLKEFKKFCDKYRISSPTIETLAAPYNSISSILRESSKRELPEFPKESKYIPYSRKLAHLLFEPIVVNRYYRKKFGSNKGTVWTVVEENGKKYLAKKDKKDWEYKKGWS